MFRVAVGDGAGGYFAGRWAYEACRAFVRLPVSLSTVPPDSDLTIAYRQARATWNRSVRLPSQDTDSPVVGTTLLLAELTPGLGDGEVGAWTLNGLARGDCNLFVIGIDGQTVATWPWERPEQVRGTDPDQLLSRLSADPLHWGFQLEDNARTRQPSVVGQVSAKTPPLPRNPRVSVQKITKSILSGIRELQDSLASEKVVLPPPAPIAQRPHHGTSPSVEIGSRHFRFKSHIVSLRPGMRLALTTDGLACWLLEGREHLQAGFWDGLIREYETNMLNTHLQSEFRSRYPDDLTLLVFEVK